MVVFFGIGGIADKNGLLSLRVQYREFLTFL